MRRLNRRGWYVLVSIASDDGDFCVDIFEHPDGGFGFQHFRSAAEDQGAWTPIGGVASPDHPSAALAADAAESAVAWLMGHPKAKAALDAWRNSPT